MVPIFIFATAVAVLISPGSPGKAAHIFPMFFILSSTKTRAAYPLPFHHTTPTTSLAPILRLLPRLGLFRHHILIHQLVQRPDLVKKLSVHKPVD